MIWRLMVQRMKLNVTCRNYRTEGAIKRKDDREEDMRQDGYAKADAVNYAPLKNKHTEEDNEVREYIEKDKERTGETTSQGNDVSQKQTSTKMHQESVL